MSSAPAGFRILEHPADLGIEASGPSLAEAFAQAASGLISIILDPTGVREAESRTVCLEAADLEQLLVRWLSEILYLYDAQRFVACAFVVEEISAHTFTAVVLGERFDPARHPTRLDVKAVTYHQVNVTQANEGVTVRVYLDI